MIAVKQCAARDGKVIEGLLEVFPTVFGDERGYFFESYSARDFAAAGIHEQFVQDNQSLSARGVLRGLHFQKKFPQAKLVRVIAGEAFDVAVDIRRASPTFGAWYGVLLSAAGHNQFFIPRGFAHGFLSMSEQTVFAYKCTEYYHPEDEGGVLWNDGAIGIEWPRLDAPCLLSEKDKRWGCLKDVP